MVRSFDCAPGQAVIDITVFIAITLLVVGFISRVHNSDKAG